MKAFWRQAGEYHPAIIRVRLALCPALSFQNIDIERRCPARDTKATGQLRRSETTGRDIAELEERAKGAGGQVEIGKHVGCGAIKRAGRAKQLHKGGKSGGVILFLGR